MSSGTTVSIPRIYVEARAGKTVKRKLLMMPKSYQDLMKCCRRLFEGYEVKAIYSADGFLIEDIDMVIPGSTIYVSSREPEPRRQPFLLSLRNPPKSPMLDPVFQSESFNKLFGSSGPCTVNDGEGKKEDSVREEEEEDKASTTELQEEEASHENENVAEPAEGSVDEEENKLEIASEVSLHSCTDDNARVLESDAEIGHELEKESDMETPHGSMIDESELEPGQNIDEFISMIGSVLGNDSLNDKTRDAFDKTEDWVQDLLGSAPELERQQAQFWFKRGHDMFASQTLPVEKEVCGYEEISQYVRKVIANHRFVSVGGVGYNMHIGIDGPRQSGKSHLLSVFADEIMLEFAMSGLWKKTFFMFMNVRLISPFLKNMEQFYLSMVDLTINNLIWQRPALQQWRSNMRKFLLGVTSSKCPRIPINSKFWQEQPQFCAALQRIGEHLFDLWIDKEALRPWMTCVFLMPSMISTAAGFTKVFYFIDNMEFADVDVTAVEPFIGSTCFVIEHLKFALEKGNFVITTENQDKFQEILAPTEAAGTDLFRDIDIVTPVGIVDEKDERVVSIDIQGEGVPFLLTANHCCGVPAYLALWKELNDAFDTAKTEEEDVDEYQVLLLTHAQHVLDVIFVMPDDDLFVTGARRK